MHACVSRSCLTPRTTAHSDTLATPLSLGPYYTDPLSTAAVACPDRRNDLRYLGTGGNFIIGVNIGGTLAG